MATWCEAYRIGHGYDVHRLITGRKLILGGVEVPYFKGLLGHSDADVLTHAIIDSLLGAAGKNSIGDYFPDDEEENKDISSLDLLKKTLEIIKPYKIINIDCTIIAEAPKFSPYIPDMKKTLSKILKTKETNIKATTTEKLGFEGKGEGISAEAVCLLRKD